MRVLASLARAYDRLPGAPPFGFSQEKIGFLISLNADGSVASFTDLREGEGAKRRPRMIPVPQPVKRTAGIAPNFLWDKTSYVLGVTAGEGKRTGEEHAAFVERHEKAMAGLDDEGLRALLAFLAAWSADQFVERGWPEEAKDQNVIFCLESDRLRNVMLHDRPAARALWVKVSAEGDKESEICLVTGEAGPVARLHPSIKGVWGAQSSGASLVSFNLDAFESYGHVQGGNAPVSVASAFAYATALNRFLEPGSSHRMQVGDASTVFWADASNAALAQEAEDIFAASFDPADDDSAATKAIGVKLAQIRAGKPIEEVEPALAEGVRFNVLGLAPNAARLSVRFHFEDDFGALTRNYQRFVRDMQVEPGPRGDYPPLWRYLTEIALLGKRENVPPNLAGQWMRSILTGTNYPLTLLSSVLTRIRADGEVNALRVGMLKAVLVRNHAMEVGKRGDKRKEAPVGLDPENRNKGYLLGRLFAAYEQVQSAALGRNVNATIKDKFYGSASAQPRKVFAMLESGSANHLSKLGKRSPGYRVLLEKTIASIMETMAPGDDPFPASLSAEDQALFGLGYYHQRSEFFRKADDANSEGSRQ